MDYGRPCFRGINGRLGALFRGDEYFRALVHGIARACYRTTDDDFKGPLARISHQVAGCYGSSDSIRGSLGVPFKVYIYNSAYLARSWVGLILKYS